MSPFLSPFLSSRAGMLSSASFSPKRRNAPLPTAPAIPPASRPSSANFSHRRPSHSAAVPALVPIRVPKLYPLLRLHLIHRKNNPVPRGHRGQRQSQRPGHDSDSTPPDETQRRQGHKALPDTSTPCRLHDLFSPKALPKVPPASSRVPNSSWRPVNLGLGAELAFKSLSKPVRLTRLFLPMV